MEERAPRTYITSALEPLALEPLVKITRLGSMNDSMDCSTRFPTSKEAAMVVNEATVVQSCLQALVVGVVTRFHFHFILHLVEMSSIPTAAMLLMSNVFVSSMSGEEKLMHSSEDIQNTRRSQAMWGAQSSRRNTTTNPLRENSVVDKDASSRRSLMPLRKLP
ncbi:hypothetical protein Ae201684P_000274 [Aphanomyces euteiches]|nr:hypothetical protein Ae201684P_000274 [Aphanomyces euteiches]